MTQPSFLRLALGFTTLACLACLPAGASAVEINDAVVINDVFEFKGTVTDIGVQRHPDRSAGSSTGSRASSNTTVSWT